MRSFITGSHAYGKPTPKSDVDLVVLVTKASAALLVESCENQEEIAKTASYGEDKKVLNIRFGKLNVLCCLTVEGFNTWKKGTAALIKLATKYGPIDREFACEYFRALRRGDKPPKYTRPKRDETPFDLDCFL